MGVDLETLHRDFSDLLRWRRPLVGTEPYKISSQFLCRDYTEALINIDDHDINIVSGA